MVLERIHCKTMLLGMQVTMGVPQKVLLRILLLVFINGGNIHTLTEFLELCPTAVALNLKVENC